MWLLYGLERHCSSRDLSTLPQLFLKPNFSLRKAIQLSDSKIICTLISWQYHQKLHSLQVNPQNYEAQNYWTQIKLLTSFHFPAEQSIMQQLIKVYDIELARITFLASAISSNNSNNLSQWVVKPCNCERHSFECYACASAVRRYYQAHLEPRAKLQTLQLVGVFIHPAAPIPVFQTLYSNNP